MDNVQNCDAYIDIPSVAGYKRKIILSSCLKSDIFVSSLVNFIIPNCFAKISNENLYDHVSIANE
jgi:hypothetical protein